MTGRLSGRHVLLGVSGGIAAYKAAALTRLLLSEGATVQVLLTRAAAQFIGPATFEGLTGRPVHHGVLSDAHRVLHLELARAADVAVFAPATANLLARFAHGLADDLSTTVFLALTCPVIIAPAMHTEMWEHPATQDNVALLARRGARILPPESGPLGGGDVGIGRLVDEREIVAAVIASLAAGGRSSIDPSGMGGRAPRSSADPSGMGGRAPRSSADPSGMGGRAPRSSADPSGMGGRAPSSSADPSGMGGRAPRSSADPSGMGGRAPRSPEGPLAGRRVVVTAGPTREPIDPVRFISNRSSGKMGYAIAAEAERRGAVVDLVSGPTALPPPAGVEVHWVETALQMREVVMPLAEKAAVIVKAAAVADHRPAAYVDRKLRKGEDDLTEIPLVPTPDILAELGAAEHGAVLVGFAAETGLEEERGRDKLLRKGLDLIVVNRIDRADAGFGTDTNRAVILGADGLRTPVSLTSKAALASVVLDHVETLLRTRQRRADARGGMGNSPDSPLD